jgi:hypothetical protein
MAFTKVGAQPLFIPRSRDQPESSRARGKARPEHCHHYEVGEHARDDTGQTPTEPRYDVRAVDRG